MTIALILVGLGIFLAVYLDWDARHPDEHWRK